MQKEIFNEDYFGTLMSILVDESRRMMPTFNPTAETHKIQNDMCKAGTWTDRMPVNTIVQSDPQESIKKLQLDVLPGYRRLAANLIEHFIKEFKAQGGDDAKIREHFERMYKWTQ
jgi:DNA-binding transcriptional regulator YhcF (GntR family)